MRKLVTTIALLLGVAPLWMNERAHAEPLVDSNLGFSMTIPDGFVRDPAPADDNPSFIYLFRRRSYPGEQTAISIRRMHCKLDQTRLTAEQIPSTFKGRLIAVQWHSLELDALEVPMQRRGNAIVSDDPVNAADAAEYDYISYNAEIPLASEGIIVGVRGQREHAKELHALFDQLVAGLDGKTNWYVSVAPGTLANWPQYGTTLLVIEVLVVLAGLAGLSALRKHSRRGVVLLVAAFILVPSCALLTNQTREGRAACYAFGSLGGLGLLFGLYDVTRPYKPRETKTPT